MHVFSPKNHLSVVTKNLLGEERGWNFAVVPQSHSKFGPDFEVTSGAQAARVWLDETGFHSDNQKLISEMPPLAYDAYQGYLVGALDGFMEAKTSYVNVSKPQPSNTLERKDWRETGNHVVHSTQHASGWRINSLVSEEQPQVFKVQVKAPNGHVTDYAFDKKGHLASHSTDGNALPDEVHQLAYGMLSGQQHGAELRREQIKQEAVDKAIGGHAGRVESRRSTASGEERGR